VLSSVGRASPLQGECQRFDPVSTHQQLTNIASILNKSARYLALFNFEGVLDYNFIYN
jgi:hypothetical protein